MDHGGPPPTLIVLERQYVSAPELLYCTADPDEWGYWGSTMRFHDQNDDIDPDIRTTFPLTYVYEPAWRWPSRWAAIDQALEENPEWGLIGCPCHGKQLGPPSLPGTSFGGLVLRAHPDGSITTAHSAPRGELEKGTPLVLYDGESPF
jgi:hypothetical protein